MESSIEKSFLLDFYGGLLTPKQRRLFSLYYEDDLSLAEVAELEDMTRQGVHDAVKRAEHQLEEMEKQLGLAERFIKVQNSIDKIKKCAYNISSADTIEKAKTEATALLSIIDELERVEK